MSRVIAAQVVCADVSIALGSVLVTDLDGSKLTLVEVLSPDETKVVGEFLVELPQRPKSLRYREVRLWHDALRAPKARVSSRADQRTSGRADQRAPKART